MDRSKREFLGTILPVAAGVPLGLFAGPTFLFQARHERPIPMPGHPTAPDPEQEPSKVDPANVRLQDQKQIQKDVQKLYKLAGELKEQVE